MSEQLKEIFRRMAQLAAAPKDPYVAIKDGPRVIVCRRSGAVKSAVK
jgi:hypothetical protein